MSNRKNIIFLTRTVLVLAVVYSVGACGKKTEATLPAAAHSRLVAAGDTITKIAFATLSAELQRAMARGGVEEALKHCNLRAAPVTDSLATAHQAGVRRVSKKWRNPNNQSDKLEEFIAKGFANDQNQKKALTPKLVLKTDTVLYYKPIVVQGLCLNCHGTPGNELTEPNDRLIRQLYPGDKAVGYQAGDVRGLWRVAFYYPGTVGNLPR